MRSGLALWTTSVVLAAATALGATNSTVVTFVDARSEALPERFRALSSAPDEPGRWRVDRVGTTPALVQSELGRRGYRLAVLDGVAIDDVHVGARMKLGDGDHAAGIAWRVQDAGSYYAARLDLDQREAVLYKFVRGNRVRLDRLAGLRLEPDRWHELLVEHRGARIQVWLNGIPVLRQEDDSVREPGSVGFWMPGDGTAAFERLWYRPLPDKAP
jgi:hypothetical protein